MSRWQALGVVISVFWLIGVPIYLTIDSNKRASDFYNWCRNLDRSFGSERTTEQQHEACWRAARFITPKVIARTLIAGNADSVTLWFLMLGPIVIFWFIVAVVLAALRVYQNGRK